VAAVTLAIAVGLADGAAAPQAGRDASPAYQSEKGRFQQALVQFMAASAGTYGDEGERLRVSVEAMQAALERWDAAIAGVDGHTALAGVYLDRGRTADALTELTAAIALEPRRPELHFFRGVAAGELGKSDEAVESLGRAADLDAGAPVPLYELSRHLRILGRDSEAAAVERRFRTAALERLSKRSPGDTFTTLTLQVPTARPMFFLARYQEAGAFLRRGAYADAIQAFRRAVDGDPLLASAGGRVDPRAREASAMLRSGSLGPAIELLTTVATAAPGDAEAERRLGIACWADERYDLSAAHLRKAVEINLHDERARLALADVLTTAGRLDEAERVLLDTVDILPASGLGWYRLGRLYHTREQYPQAVAALQRAAALETLGGLDTVYQVIGLVETLQQNGGNAVAAYRRRTAINPNDSGAHRALGDALRDVDQDEEAATEYLAALVVDPADALALTALASIDLQRQQYEEAVAAASRAVNLNAENKEAQYTLATALVRLGRTEEGAAPLRAFQRLQEAEMARDRRVYALNALRRGASLALQRGDAAAAVKSLEEAIELEGNDASLHADIGAALLKAGRAGDAVVHFQRALELDKATDVIQSLAEAYNALGKVEERRRYSEMYERQKADRMRRGELR
jgi:tetratricopeptide (TPR) repeat protein